MTTIPPAPSAPQPLRFLDGFAGIGGFALALTELGHECVGFSEIDAPASSVYLRHFPTHHPYGDITRIAAESLPAFDLLCGGFPCQAFSVAGKRRGFADTRGTLFFDICRIAKAKRPRLLLLENVKGLLSHGGGETFGVILSALDELGYDADWQVCNSRHFGVPQNRERVFLVGHLRGTPPPQVFPIGGVTSEAAEQNWPADTFGRRLFYHVDPAGDGANCYWKESDVAGTITAQQFANRGTRVIEPVIYEQNIDGKTRVRDVCPTLRSPNTIWNMPIGTVAGIRRLTPLECERLQTFPDGWTEFGVDEDGNLVRISDTQRYKMLGNSVTVNVVRQIVRRLTEGGV